MLHDSLGTCTRTTRLNWLLSHFHLWLCSQLVANHEIPPTWCRRPSSVCCVPCECFIAVRLNSPWWVEQSLFITLTDEIHWEWCIYLQLCCVCQQYGDNRQGQQWLQNFVPFLIMKRSPAQTSLAADLVPVSSETSKLHRPLLVSACNAQIVNSSLALQNIHLPF